MFTHANKSKPPFGCASLVAASNVAKFVIRCGMCARFTDMEVGMAHALSEAIAWSAGCDGPFLRMRILLHIACTRSNADNVSVRPTGTCMV